MDLHKAKPTKDDQWRVFSYGKVGCSTSGDFFLNQDLPMRVPAIRSLRNYPERIRSVEQAQAIQGIGEKTAHKVCQVPILY